MHTNKLALLGGKKLIESQFPLYNSYGQEEVDAANRVLRSGVLSKFIGAWHEDFYGGPEVRAFEAEWASYFGAKFAVAVNSNTSGLMAAIGAIGIEPGDEVIVSPWTMCASATSILVWNGIPVFADIEPETFNLDPKSIERAISPRTRAIVVTDIFGHPADMQAIMLIAKKYNLMVIEDAAQAPGAKYHGKYAGTLANIGVFSLNYHKHIHTGEGGICVTDSAEFAERMQLIRNHAEAVVAGKGVDNISNMIGFNFRMGEIEAAMGREQLKKLNRFVQQRIDAADRLSAALSMLDGLQVPIIKPGCDHVYYVYPIILDTKHLGVAKFKIVDALIAEGVPSVMRGYINLHLLPMYQQKIAYGRSGYPWRDGEHISKVSYEKGICPVAEDMQDNSMFALGLCVHNFNNVEVDLVISAFRKVWDNLAYLR